MVTIIVWSVVGALALLCLVLTLFTVKQQTTAVIQRLGKFARLAGPGLNFKIPFIDSVAGRPSMRVQQLDVKVETKTKDNVFVIAVVSVQYYILEDKVYEAFYRLTNARSQIEKYVFDVIRSQIPKMDLDEVFDNKDAVSDTVKQELGEAMDEYGYGIVKTLVTDIDPDSSVKKAMNEINAAQRERVAAEQKGEADKILQVKAAEAEAESKALQGKGIADQRKAIVDGLRESVADFQQVVGDTSANEVITMVLLTQYLDTLKDIGSSNRSSTVFMPHSPGALADLMGQIQSAIASANQVPTRSDVGDDG
jgi:regulator of protease activity HflC (stomatin/prohibitin superfamily)